MRIDRFVLDNNIWVSYFIMKREEQLASITDEYGISIFACDELFIEFAEVLAYPHLKKYDIDILSALRTLKSITIYHELTYPIKRYLPKDENDDYLIALALQTSSSFITSGDDDILSEKENLERKYKKLKILTKKEFEDMFG